MIRTSIFIAALATAGAASLVLSARADAAAMRWAIGRAILSYW
jgi:hypothetical protein